MPIAPPAAPTPEPQPLRAPYRPPSGGWDEMVAADGSVRPHWRSVAPLLSASAASQLNSRAAAVRRLLQDHGVTYNVYDDALGTSRPWELDLIPHIVDEAEFRQVARGLNQRARLLEAILSDLYGSQRLLRENLLPPALVYACPGFLRSSVGTSPAGGRFLNLYACDLARDPQGLWRVMADRTQTPSALGYALENRTIIRQVMAGEFQRAQVQRLAGYYDRLRLTLQHLSPQGRLGEAGILMLTPGPRDATYFEHAFLARQLGFPLVEGADLTVRDRRVWLKTLEGLKRVDVVLRFLEDEWCDPLELRSSSHLGTPGLAEAWRSGSVSLANGLGTGLVETPALHPFLPALSRALLDEELLLPGVVTWWCGQPQELKAVLDQPARWVLKPAFVRGARDPLFLADLSREELTAALSQLRARPQDWIAQERLNFSTTPSLTSAGTVEPRPLVWRTLLSATQRGDYETLPGGLTRVSAAPDRWVITMRSGSISKDTWIASSAPVLDHPLSRPAISLPTAAQPAAAASLRPARPPSGVPSRAADHLFWLGRYTERLEQTVRLLRAHLRRSTSEGGLATGEEIHTCLALMAGLNLLDWTPDQPDPDITPLLLDTQHPGSIPDLIERVQFNAAAARDRLSDDTWRLLNRLDADAPSHRRPPQAAEMLQSLDALILDTAAFGGMHLDNVTRGHGWRFLEIGRRLERAATNLEILRFGAGASPARLVPLLEICDSTMTYRRLHFAAPTLPLTLDLLLQDESNPRSVFFQLDALLQQTSALPAESAEGPPSSELKKAAAIREAVQQFPISTLSAEARLEPALTQLCVAQVAELETFSDLLTERYFSHANRHKYRPNSPSSP